MNVYDIVQIVFAVGAATVLGRLGLALARRIERRPAPPRLEVTTPTRHALEEECAALRREVAELHERQDFTERLLLQRHDADEARIPTPR